MIAYDRFMIESQVYYDQLAFIYQRAKIHYMIDDNRNTEMRVKLEPETQKLVDAIYEMIEDLRVSINKRYLCE